MDKRFSLALKYYDSGLAEQAWHVLRELVGEADPSSEALHFAATLRLEVSAFEDVLALTAKLRELNPQSVDALIMSGQALLALDRLDEAGQVFSDAVKFEPENPEVQFNLGHWHHRMGRLNEAEQSYRIALSGRESFAQAWNNLGNVLDALDRPDEAVAAYKNAIAQQSDFSLAFNNLGASLAGQGRFTAATEAYTKALEADSANTAARVNLGVSLLECCEFGASISAFDEVLRAEPHNRDAAHNRLYAQIYAEDAPDALLTTHAEWGKTVAADDCPEPADPTPDRCLRVGYISPDFRRHSVSFFVEPLLSNHNRKNVEVFCYSDTAHPDNVTSRLQGCAQHWRNTYGQNDRAVLELIRDDRIDVLVDLAGHTTGSRLLVFAQGAAPVQVTGLGYPATTGLPTMSHRLCDDVTDPAPNADRWSTETLTRLSGGLHCFRPPDSAGECEALPAEKNGFITFGSFNKLAKVSELTVKLWADVLRLVPGSRLLLKSKPLVEEETRSKMRKAFEAHGISSDRLDLMGWVGGDREHLETYGGIDIALDTFPYNGTATTCEALWMGVPVVTLAGRGHAARVGASLLTQIGRSEWVAENSAQYVICAQELSADVAALAEVRKTLRGAMSESSLCDEKLYAQSVESAYRAAWRVRCET